MARLVKIFYIAVCINSFHVGMWERMCDGGGGGMWRKGEREEERVALNHHCLEEAFHFMLKSVFQFEFSNISHAEENY